MDKKYIALGIIIINIFAFAMYSAFSGDYPPEITVFSNDLSGEGDAVYVFCLAKSSIEHEVEKSYFIIMDSMGNYLHHKVIDFAYFDYIYQINETTFFYKTSGRREHPEIQGSYLWNFETDVTIHILKELDIKGHHELLIEDRYFTTLRRSGKHGWDTIVQIDIEGNALTFFNSTEYFLEQPCNDSRNNDWLHSNDVTVSLDGQFYYINFRNADSIGKINIESKELMWICGRDGDFTLKDSEGNAVESLWYHSHIIKEIRPNVFLMFDNDLHNSSKNYPKWTNPQESNFGGQSRLIEFTIDPVTMEAWISWDYTPSEIFYSSGFGDIELLSNGNIVGVFGQQPHKFNIDGSLTDEPFGASIHEVNEDGELVKEYRFPEGYAIYRIQLYSENPEDWTDISWFPGV